MDDLDLDALKRRANHAGPGAVRLSGDTVSALISRLRAAEERVRELEAALGKQWREGYDDGYGSALTDGAELRAVADSARVVDMAETHRGNCDADPCIFCGALTVLSVMVGALDAAKKEEPHG